MFTGKNFHLLVIIYIILVVDKNFRSSTTLKTKLERIYIDSVLCRMPEVSSQHNKLDGKTFKMKERF
jgi:hypothetical protein